MKPACLQVSAAALLVPAAVLQAEGVAAPAAKAKNQ
jgi:hypothetical protein